MTREFQDVEKQSMNNRLIFTVLMPQRNQIDLVASLTIVETETVQPKS